MVHHMVLGERERERERERESSESSERSESLKKGKREKKERKEGGWSALQLRCVFLSCIYLSVHFK